MPQRRKKYTLVAAFARCSLGLNSVRILSSLTGRAVESAPVADSDSFDRAWALTACLPMAIVDSQMILKLTELVLGVAII